jgi:hypothetical protein
MGAHPFGVQGNVYVQNGDFPHVASWVPPPRNQISKLEKTTVGAKITGLRGVAGAISGNHLVIRHETTRLSGASEHCEALIG